MHQEQPERRHRTREIVEKLLAERTEVLVLYCRAAGLDSLPSPGQKPVVEPVEHIVEEFCQMLVDYLAAGHFSLYDRISQGNERRRQVIQVAEEVYPELTETTQTILDFNDAYQDPERARDREQLAADLSTLGEQLALRVELEDRLLKSLR